MDKRVTTQCPICNTQRTLFVPAEGYRRWKFEDVPIRRAFPELSEGDRETLLTGICSKCWDGLFKEGD